MEEIPEKIPEKMRGVHKPSVSVVMPVYNSERYLSKAIESILNQTFRDFEFLIFDDGSTDDSRRIIDHYAGIDSRIIPYHSDFNTGYVSLLNKGTKLARGYLIARMDSDDMSLPHRLQVQKDFLDNHPSVGVVGSSSIRIDESDRELGISMRMEDPAFLYWLSFFSNPLSHPTVMYRKEIFNTIEGYDESKMPAEDYDLWTRLIPLWKLSNVRDPLLKYREHARSVSSTKRELQIKNSTESLKSLWRHELGISVTDEEVLFLKSFHKGFDDLSPVAAYPLFRKMCNLENKVRGMFGPVSDDLEFEYFKRCLYLATKSRRHSYGHFIKITIHLLKRYHKFVIRYLLYGKA